METASGWFSGCRAASIAAGVIWKGTGDMLAVRLNKAQFEYDIHSIIKAFYPAETVKVFEEGTKDFESDGDNPQKYVKRMMAR